ncbi:metal-binding protein [Ectothiorhodospira haloalkaliphila]|uniref:Metal-binding protein n=1 Tax=Ectothiorhodospira haloalkaliphila TaxID=421628 RepID=W8KDQ2_9GAMM|nr:MULTISPECIES: CHAD domain-containing protein [Ectothiorhodospira]AHK77909.1 metal-binding protein [Ectothiorhodospira haloalkaliphila]MCG5494947.1 CHAD domain-containing protein [Ectothiorhodospira variabilis]MCG5496290.1 CHAD domain-containing protein [Ectothiorhodospira variabilis]MCG5504460.1 CHAD domain-containing protein [Ectothiorhodospira variabilis]MCG5507674.1 CHAD domain-containing protein [Ectothiorhodospira variabilis]
MKQPLAAQPASRAVRHLARTYLDQAQAACDRLDDPADTEALHDFRVALRRLRSLLKAHKGYAKQWLSKKLRQRAKDLASSTGLARDTEVQLAWLMTQQERIKSHQRPGFLWMKERLQDRLGDEYADIRQATPSAFKRFRKRMNERLDLDKDDDAPPFGRVTALRLTEAAEDFRAHLDQVKMGAAQEEVHQARIAGKRLRYLLEPVAKELEGGKDLIKELKEMQDLMGEIHDIQVFAEELAQASEEAGAERMRRMVELSLARGQDDPDLQAARRTDERAGLMSLARQLHDRQEHLMSRLTAKLEDGEAERFLAHLAQAAEQLDVLAYPEG